MNIPTRSIIVLTVVAAVALAFVARQTRNTQLASPVESVASVTPTSPIEAETVAAPAHATAPLPRLVDLGAGKCVPCKMMAPILEELKRDYADRFTTEFIDVWENRAAGQQYGIEVIPTQIFYDAEGKERFRHAGFFGKADILGQWEKLGVDVGGPPSAGIERETPAVGGKLKSTPP